MNTLSLIEEMNKNAEDYGDSSSEEDKAILEVVNAMIEKGKQVSVADAIFLGMHLRSRRLTGDSVTGGKKSLVADVLDKQLKELGIEVVK